MTSLWRHVKRKLPRFTEPTLKRARHAIFVLDFRHGCAHIITFSLTARCVVVFIIWCQDYGRVVNGRHVSRLCALLKDVNPEAKVETGGLDKVIKKLLLLTSFLPSLIR